MVRVKVSYREDEDGDGGVELRPAAVSLLLLDELVELGLQVTAHRHVGEHAVKLVGELVAARLL